MQNSQNSNVTLFVDYIPAELKANQTWEIVYYVKNPFTNKLVRKRNRVRPLSSVTSRKKLAKQMINNINQRLESGWNPFYQNKNTKEFKPLIEVCNIYIKRIEKEYKDENLRFDTHKTYKSQITLLINYIIDIVQSADMMCYKFNNDFVGNYLDYIRYDKGLSARTRDNYLGFLCTLSAFMLEKKYIVANPTEHFTRINKKKKKRVIIDDATKKIIFRYWKRENPSFLALCLTCYYCLVRRTELTKIKVGDVNFENQTLFIDSSDSKNRKSAFVTIPDELMKLLYTHLENAPKEAYLFSSKDFTPGYTKLNPDIITKRWRTMRAKLNIDNTIDWYSLKDTGITDLLLNNVPLISVRDQARHFSSIQTDSYTPRQMRKGDENIKASNLKFN